MTPTELKNAINELTPFYEQVGKGGLFAQMPDKDKIEAFVAKINKIVDPTIDKLQAEIENEFVAVTTLEEKPNRLTKITIEAPILISKEDHKATTYVEAVAKRINGSKESMHFARMLAILLRCIHFETNAPTFMTALEVPAKYLAVKEQANFASMVAAVHKGDEKNVSILKSRINVGPA